LRDSVPTQPINLPDMESKVGRRPLLIITGGVDAGRVVPIDSSLITIGRSLDCSIHPDDPGLSRVHAHILSVDGQVVFADARSTNGSRVNSMRVREPVRLHDGDRVQLGTSTTMMFTIASDGELASLSDAYQGSLRDPLTGLFNRRYLDTALAAEVKLAKRKQLPLSLLLLDLDHFKRVNDEFGHQAGDEVLRRAAAVLSAELRAEDLLARFGGEEFLMIARATTLPDAYIVAERLRSAVEQARFGWKEHVIPLTVSIGVASLRFDGEGSSPTALISEADKRLYAAKLRRNRVVGA
jgi:diguanylate cyclase (GGDEF)-like protein